MKVVSSLCIVHAYITLDIAGDEMTHIFSPVNVEFSAWMTRSACFEKCCGFISRGLRATYRGPPEDPFAVWYVL